MDGIQKIFYVVIGLVVAVPIGAVYAQLSSTDLTLVQEAQEYSRKFTGDYFSDVKDPTYTINTYESLCRGYYIRHETDTTVEYIGYGDLADKYTYTEQKVSSKIATSSDPAIADVPVSTTTEPSAISI